MSAYETVTEELAREPRAWLVTGVARFIGSNLLQRLLRLGQRVVGLDNLAPGHERNLAEVPEAVSAEEWGASDSSVATLRFWRTAGRLSRASTTFYIRLRSGRCRAPSRTPSGPTRPTSPGS